MNSKKILAVGLLIVAAICFAVVLARIFIENKSSPTASLQIDSVPKATVLVNDQKVGQTPFLKEGLSPQEYKIKLIPSGETAGTFVNWESKVKLAENTLTYVSRNLASSEELSAGQILMLEKLPLSNVQEMAIISSPDNALVSVDGQQEGRTSVILKNLGTGDHEVIVSLPGFFDEVVHAKMVDGYRLNIVTKLASRPQAPSPTSVRSTTDLVASVGGQIAKPYALIKETGTGFLRVHTEPNVNSSESARVKPGEKYSIISEATGWVKIKLPTLFGWVTQQYVEVVR